MTIALSSLSSRLLLSISFSSFSEVLSCSFDWNIFLCLLVLTNFLFVSMLPETGVRSLGWEDPLEEGTATHSGILAWRIPMSRGAWQGVHGVSESDMTERLSAAHHKHIVFSILSQILKTVSYVFSNACSIQLLTLCIHHLLSIVSDSALMESCCCCC